MSMKLRHLAVAAAILVFANGAFANSITSNISVVGNTIYFGAMHTDGDPFTDTFNFTNVAGLVLADVSLITTGSGAFNIDFGSAALNGFSLSLSGTGVTEWGSANGLLLTGPLQLIVTGTTGAGGGIFSSYSGTLNVTQIPEPGAYALMLSGLAGLGFIGRRNRLS